MLRKNVAVGYFTIVVLLVAACVTNATASDSRSNFDQSSSKYLVVLSNGVTEPEVSERQASVIVRSVAQEYARSRGVKIVTTYSGSLNGFMLEADSATAKRLAHDERIEIVLKIPSTTQPHTAPGLYSGPSLDSGYSLQDECPYSYCGHMTVTGFVIKHVVDMSGFVPPGLSHTMREVAELDPFVEIVVPF